MTKQYRLFMLLLGCKPPGRHTEQHDIYFGIGESLGDLLDDIYAFWPEAREKIHIDAWRQVCRVDDFEIRIVAAPEADSMNKRRLFFLNLGGYKPGEFEEFHYKMLAVGENKGEVVQSAKQTAFFRHTGFDGANSHIDDKYGVDVDDLYDIEEILSPVMKSRFRLMVSVAAPGFPDDEIHLGYLKTSQLQTARTPRGAGL